MLDWRKALVAATATLSIGAAQAAYILDTGQPALGSTQVSLSNFTSSGGGFQHLGVTFNVSQASTITSVEGWIENLGQAAGDVLFELHSGASPTGGLLFTSGVVSIPTGAADWRGETGLSWGVTAGDYTLIAMAQSGFSGGMGTNPTSPAGTEWVNNPLTNGWATTTFDMGWRIAAEPSSVPEPGSLALIALGLAFLGGSAARKRRA